MWYSGIFILISKDIFTDFLLLEADRFILPFDKKILKYRSKNFSENDLEAIILP